QANCATLRGDLASSTLFGHKAGAFTGATTDRSGLLRAADGGLLFLDEIGELGLDEQAMLLRALEEGIFQPLGSDKLEQSSFQLIAGTNRDLGALSQSGDFREDLLARIDLWTFELPPLRNRLEDIEPNLDYELERVTRESGRRVTMARGAREQFLAFSTAPGTSWRGNFRDFAAAVTRMTTLAPNGRIPVDGVRDEIRRLESRWNSLQGRPAQSDPLRAVLGEGAATELDRFDRVQLADVLQVCLASKSLSAAGRSLFAASRLRRTSRNDADRLRKYLARFDLTWESIQDR
ncbi:MAG: transcriptional regulatory protein RtcR, partial [Planctomycetota bacterium]